MNNITLPKDLESKETNPLMKARPLVRTPRDRSAYYNCDCQARRRCVSGAKYPRKEFQDRFDETFETTTEPVDVLILTEDIMHSQRKKYLIELIKKVFRTTGFIHTRYAIRPALGCLAKLRDYDKITNKEFQVCKKHHIKKIIEQHNPKAIVAIGKSISTITEITSLNYSHFYSLEEDDCWIWSNEFQCRVYPAPSVHTWMNWNRDEIDMPLTEEEESSLSPDEVAEIVLESQDQLKSRKTADGEEQESNHIQLDVFERYWTIQQLEKANAEAKRRNAPDELPPEKFVFIEPVDANQFLEDLINNDAITHIAMDTETTGFHFFEDQIHCITLAYDDHHGYFLPFKKLDKDLLNRFFRTEHFIFIWHNAPFDLKFLKEAGIADARCDHDTIIASNAVNENSPNGLKSLTWIYTKHGGYEKVLKDFMHKHKIKDMTKLPHDLLLEYACTDAVLTYILFNYFLNRLAEEQGPKHNYENIVMPAVEMQVSIERLGIGIDLAYMYQLNDSTKIRISKIAKVIYSRFNNGVELNLSSNQQVSALFWSIPGFIIARDGRHKFMLSKDGSLNVGKEALLNYRLGGNDRTQRLAWLLLHIRKLEYRLTVFGIENYRKANSKHKNKLGYINTEAFWDIDEGIPFDPKDQLEFERDPSKGYLGSVYKLNGQNRLFGGFKLFGTTTGRMAGGGGLRSTINPQNFTKDLTFRKIFTAPEDFVMVEADFQQMELCLAAQLAGPGNLGDAIMSGLDVHSYTGYRLYNKMEGTDVTYQDFYSLRVTDSLIKDYRARAKVINFSCLYGASATGIAIQLKEPRNIAQEYLDSFFETYPELLQMRNFYVKHAQQYGFVFNFMWKKRRIPELTYTLGLLKKDKFSGKHLGRHRAFSNWVNSAFNSPIQGSSGQITIAAMTDIYHAFKDQNFKSRVLVNVHDAIWFELYLPEVDAAMEIVKYQMERDDRYEIKSGSQVKLKIDATFGGPYGFGKSYKEWKGVK